MNDVQCRLCEGADNSFLRRGVRYAEELEVRRCNGCGLVFLWPLPNREDIAGYYVNEYGSDYEEPPVEQRYRRDLDEARTRVRRLLPYLNQDTRLLEVGSGSGAFVDSVRPYVSVVQGVEPGRESRKWARESLGAELLAALPSSDGGSVTFDVIVSFHVIEHVLDPVRFMTELKPLLKPEGTAFIEAPNVNDALVSLYRIPSYARFYYQKAHLFYFSESTLALCLEKAGFEARISGLQRYDLSNHIRWMLTGEPGGQNFYHNVLDPSANAAYAQSLIRSGYYDTLWVEAKVKAEDPGNRL